MLPHWSTVWCWWRPMAVLIHVDVRQAAQVEALNRDLAHCRHTVVEQQHRAWVRCRSGGSRLRCRCRGRWQCRRPMYRCRSPLRWGSGLEPPHECALCLYAIATDATLRLQGPAHEYTQPQECTTSPKQLHGAPRTTSVTISMRRTQSAIVRALKARLSADGRVARGGPSCCLFSPTGGIARLIFSCWRYGHSSGSLCSPG